MKRVSILLLLTAVLFIAGGCSKEFLDGGESTYLSQKKLEELTKRPALAAKFSESKVRGVYTDLREFGHSRGYPLRNGLKCHLYALDVTCQSIVANPNFVLRRDYLRMDFDPKGIRNYHMWQGLYGIIASINGIINTTLPKDEADVKGAVEAVYGEAHTLRGICYYYLLNCFSMPYVTGSKDKPAIPLVLTGVDEEIKTQVTVQQVYEQIISDLKKGAKYGAKAMKDKSRVGADVANTFLTKVYMEMANWEEAEKAASAAFGDVFEPKPFPNAQNMEYCSLAVDDNMWGFDVNAKTSMTWISFASVVDPTSSFSYFDVTKTYIYNYLYSKLPPTDARRDWFIPKGFTSPDQPEFLEFQNKWGGSIVPGPLPYISLKFHGEPDCTSDEIYLRYADPYLMRIEALYELGRIDEAKQFLNKFVQARDASYDCSSLSGEALRDEIRFQRRIELWGEGTEWFDFRRWQVPIYRTLPTLDGELSNHKSVLGTIQPGSPFYAYPIPEDEILQNPNFVQNPNYTP